MSEFDDIAVIDEAFAGFQASVAPSVSGVDTNAVHDTVMRRRRTRTTLFSVLAILAIAVPVAVYSAVTNGDQGPPPIPADSGTPTAPPTSAPPVGPPPDGRFTIEQLTSGPVYVPEWGNAGAGCPTGTVSLKASGTTDLVVSTIIHTNLDGDSAAETAAMIQCFYEGSTISKQIVAFDRTVADGFGTLGQILLMETNTHAPEMVARPRGGVSVRIDSPVLGGPRFEEYAWDGQKISAVPPGGKTAGFLDDADISAGKVPVPSWGPGLENCQSGQVQLNASFLIGTWQITHFNSDSDDDFETAVLIHCREAVSQVVVYDRDTAGKI